MEAKFGTDGIRGIVGPELDATLALKIGASAVQVLKKDKNKRLKFLIGSDTRISKDVLKHGLVAGILSEDADAIDLGVIPTPAVAYLIKKYNADGGFVISASHNPSKYNGIKIFSSESMKLDDDIERKIERHINNFTSSHEVNKVGTYSYDEQAKENYVDFLASTISTKIEGITAGIDAANGAASITSKMLFEKLGIDYMIINDTPDGLNINDNAGSTHIDNLKKFVVEHHLDCGVAFDGDADRCMMVDEFGNLVDGDTIMAICGLHLKEKQALKNNTIVGTVMSNMGLAKFCKDHDINFVATKVGDRYVLENMLANDYIIGGEQSGHIIFRSLASTGDGELTALQVLQVMSEKHKSLSSLASIKKTYPQVLKNVETSREGKEAYLTNANVQQKITEITSLLGDEGRVLVRPSGTENLVRVMLEGQDETVINEYCDEIVKVMTKELK